MVPRLVLDGAALVANWRALDRLSAPGQAAAVVKADAYGLGAVEVVRRLSAAGCRQFYVAHWAEAQALVAAGVLPGERISVLHGLAAGDEPFARSSGARPVLNSPAQLARWQSMGGGACDVMVDTGMNRLGFAPDELGAIDWSGFIVDTVMSHLACADSDHPLNDAQRAGFNAARALVPARRASLANSAGIVLGGAYAFDITRPGLALYGGLPRAELTDVIRPVVAIEAPVIRLRTVSAGATVGYGADFVAQRETRIACLALGYADGYKRALAGIGGFRLGDRHLPLVGRVSMDLVCVDATDAPELAEGDWLSADFNLAEAEARTGIAQYEWLTHLGKRFERVWRDLA